MDFRQRVDDILNHSMDVFGEEVKFFPRSTVGGVHKGRAVFNNEGRALDLDTEQVLSVNQPELGINLNDFSFEIMTNDLCEVRGVRYRIIDKVEDGQGGAMLRLHKVDINERIADTKVR